MAMVLGLSLTACGSNGGDNTSGGSGTTADGGGRQQ